MPSETDLRDLDVVTDVQLYILDGHTPVAEPDLLAWGRWMQLHDRHVAEHRSQDRSWFVSTLFTGVNMRLFSVRGHPAQPLLFETMAFLGHHIEAQDRCATWDEAAKQHALVVARVERARGIPLVEVPHG